MQKSDLRAELLKEPIPLLVSKWVFERVPSLFGTDNLAYIAWKEKLANKLGVDSRAILVIGSASCGFSLNPFKNYRDFDSTSDIDVGLVSQFHFDIAWHALRNLGGKKYRLSVKQESAVKDHVQRLIYWGTIATDKILPLLPYAKEWISSLEELGKVPPANGREIKVRVYRDFESLKAYHLRNFSLLRDQEIGV